MATVHWCLFLIVTLMAGYECSRFENTLLDNATKYVCTVSTAILPWTVQLGVGEDIMDVHWTFAGHSNETVMAVFAQGSFLSSPAFSSRVHSLPNAGLVLTSVSIADSGMYTVEALVRNKSTGRMTSLRRKAHLIVIDDILSSAQVTVRLEQQAVFNSVTSQLSVTLTCGQFVFSGDNPPFQVEWTDPSGNIIPGSHYNKGLFYLMLDNPVQGGRYGCRVLASAMVCQQRGQETMEGSVTVDGLAARVTVLEAQQAQLLQDNARLRNNASVMNGENESLKLSVKALLTSQAQLVQEHGSLKQQSEDLQNKANATQAAVALLQQQIQTLEALSSKQQSVLAVPSLQNQLNLLNRSTVQCCQTVSKLAQQRSELTQEKTVLSLSLQNLTQKLNESDARWSSDLSNLTNYLHEIDQKTFSLETDIHSLGDIFNQSKQVYHDLSQKVLVLKTEANLTSQQLAVLNTSKDLSDLENIKDELHRLHSDQLQADVSFHTRMTATDNVHPSDGAPVVFTNVINNRHSAYNSTSGKFTCPRAGTYFFMATFSAKDRQNVVQVYLMKDDVEMDYGETYSERHYGSGAVHAILDLEQGQTVWLKNYGPDNSFATASGSFSGVLITPQS